MYETLEAETIAREATASAALAAHETKLDNLAGREENLLTGVTAIEGKIPKLEMDLAMAVSRCKALGYHDAQDKLAAMMA